MSSVTLRPYQEEDVAKTLHHLGINRAALANLHTGSGKTTFASFIAKRWSGRVLWLAHRDFLLAQARDRLTELTGEYVSLEKANWRETGSRIVAASVQSLKGARLQRFAKDAFSLLIVDEAHHASSPGYRKVLDHFDSAKLLGLTATPKRHDGKGAWNIWGDKPACERTIEWGVKNGYFVQPVPISRFIDAIHLEGIKTIAGDLALNALETEIARSSGAIATLVSEEMADRPTIVYTPGVASAQAVASALVLLGKSAVSVDQDSPPRLRADALGRFGDTLQYIVNCAIYLEGLDVPKARGIAIARPTKSTGLYTQMVGRGGRPEGWIGQLATAEERLAAIKASGKPDFLLLDISGTAGRHTLATPIDVMAGSELPAIKDRAKKILERQEEPGLTVDQAIDESRKELEAEETVNQARVAAAAARAQIKARKGTWDAFARLGAEPTQPGSTLPWLARPASAVEVAWCKENRLPFVGVTSGQVQSLQKQAKEWYRLGKPNFRQRAQLVRTGASLDITYDQAKAIMVAMKRNGWRPLAKGLIDAIVNAPSRPLVATAENPLSVSAVERALDADRIPF